MYEYDTDDTPIADTEQQCAEVLTDALYEQGVTDIRSFEDAGLMTRNTGITVRFGNSEFQVTIVQSA